MLMLHPTTRRLLRAPSGLLASSQGCCCVGNPPIASVCCCPDNLMPERLLLTFTGCTGAAACLNGLEYTLIWNLGGSGSSVWTADSPVGCDGKTFSAFEWRCNLPACTWSLQLAGCVAVLDTADSLSCDPFSASGSFVATGGTCVNFGDTVGWTLVPA